jgi:glutaredoxin 2
LHRGNNHFTLVISWPGGGYNAKDPFIESILNNQDTPKLRQIKHEVDEMVDEKAKLQDNFKEEFNNNQVEPDKIIAKFKRGLHAFWKSHVNTLNEPIGNENTDIFNLLQHLFTIEGEKQILKDKRGDNNVLEDVFMDDFKP